MITEEQLYAMVDGLERTELTICIESGWVAPRREQARYVFTEVDVARIRLIREIRHDLAVDDEAVPVVLSLLDQVYSLRRELRAVLQAIGTQPEPVRRDIARRVRERGEGDAPG